MAQNDTSLPPKVCKSWQNSGTEAHSVNMDPTAEHQWCPEIVDIMAKYGQTPEDFIVRDDEDGVDIQDGEQFPTNDSNRVGQCKHSLLCHKKTEKEQLPMLKIKIRGFQAGANRKKSSSKLSSPSSGAKPISAIHNPKGDDTDSEPENSVAVALAGVFAILINKIYKIMEIFE